MESIIAATVQQLTPGSISGWLLVFIAVIWLSRDIRERSKLSAEDRLALREGYAKQVADLTKENRDLRQEHSEYRKACQQETDILRATVRQALDKIAKLERALASAADNGVYVKFQKEDIPRESRVKK